MEEAKCNFALRAHPKTPCTTSPFTSFSRRAKPFRKKMDRFQLVDSAEPLFMPLVVLGELLKGALKSANPAKHRGRIAELLKVVAVVNPDTATAENYAAIASALEAKGEPIPENDVWIAALARELDMPLAARDAHFDRVEGLTLLNW